MLTCAEGREIRAPVIGSDGHVYDSLVLRDWLRRGAQCVIPGCAIEHVDMQLRGTATVLGSVRMAHAALRRWSRSVFTPLGVRHRASIRKKCMQLRVLDSYKSRFNAFRAPCGRSGLVGRDPYRSAFS